MITVKKLKEVLKNMPDDAKVYAYDGEHCGIAIIDYVKPLVNKKHKRINMEWFIEANESPEEDTYTEGFNNDK